MDLDEALHRTGGAGRYQRLVGWLLLLPGALPVGLYTLLVLLQVNDRGQHWCRVPELQISAINETVAKRYSIPLQSAVAGAVTSGGFSSCHMYDVNYTRLARRLEAGRSRDNATDLTPFASTWPVTTCRHGWRHEPGRAMTVTAKFELVCENAHLVSALVSAVGAGTVGGQLVVFSFRNRLSRRWMFLFSLLLYLAAGVGSLGCQQPVCLLLTSSAVAAAAGALGHNQLSLVLELTPASAHHLGHMAERLVAAGAPLLLAGVAELTRQWSTAVLASVLPCAVFLLFWCAMPESPVWLVSRGYWSEVHRLLERVSRLNGQPTDVGFLTEQLQENPEEELALSWEELFFSNRQQRRVAALFLLILLSSLTYHQAAAASLSRWPGAARPLLLLGAAQLLACPLAWAAAQAAGRRSSLLASLSLTAAACALSAYLQQRAMSAAALDSLTFLLTLLSEISLLLLLLTGCGLLPSLLASHGLLVLRSAQMLGYTALPALSLLTPEWRVLMTLAGLHGLGAAAALLLPETLHQPRPRLPSESHNIRWPLFRFRPRRPLRLYRHQCCGCHSTPDPESRQQLTSPTSANATHRVLTRPRGTVTPMSENRSRANGELVLGVPRAPRPPVVPREDKMYITVL